MRVLQCDVEANSWVPQRVLRPQMPLLSQQTGHPDRRPHCHRQVLLTLPGALLLRLEPAHHKLAQHRDVMAQEVLLDRACEANSRPQTTHIRMLVSSCFSP